MKKTIISFCLIAFAAATFTACQKETAQPSNSVDAGSVSNIGKTKPGYPIWLDTTSIGQAIPIGSTGDNTQTKTNP